MEGKADRFDVAGPAVRVLPRRVVLGLVSTKTPTLESAFIELTGKGAA